MDGLTDCIFFPHIMGWIDGWIEKWMNGWMDGLNR